MSFEDDFVVPAGHKSEPSPAPSFSSTLADPGLPVEEGWATFDTFDDLVAPESDDDSWEGWGDFGDFSPSAVSELSEQIDLLALDIDDEVPTPTPPTPKIALEASPSLIDLDEVPSRPVDRPPTTTTATKGPSRQTAVAVAHSPR